MSPICCIFVWWKKYCATPQAEHNILFHHTNIQHIGRTKSTNISYIIHSLILLLTPLYQSSAIQCHPWIQAKLCNTPPSCCHYHLGHFPINWKGANVQRSRLYYLTQTCQFQKVVLLDAPGVREGIDRKVGHKRPCPMWPLGVTFDIVVQPIQAKGQV